MSIFKTPEEIWQAACEAQMKEVYDKIPPGQNTNASAIKYWTKTPPFPNPSIVAVYSGPSKLNDQLVTENKKMREVIEVLLNLVNQSNGVHEYHTNGDIAKWAEFEFIQWAKDIINPPIDQSINPSTNPPKI